MGTKVREVMTTELVTLEPGEAVAKAAKRMRLSDVGDVLVARNGRLEGILTDRDIVVRCLAEDADPERTPVEAVCSSALATLSPDDDADDAVRLMGKKAIRRVPVVEDGRLVGVLSIGDLAQADGRESALQGISAAAPNR